MKHIKLFEEFIAEAANDPIEIVSYTDALDNRRDTTTRKAAEIAAALKNSEEFSDDMRFTDAQKRLYFIDDLIGKSVKVGSEVFVVEESLVAEKEFSAAEREKLADKGFALPDGSFPIENEGDLQNAVSAFGRSNPNKRSDVAKHIAKRAKALGKEDMIPQTDIFQKALKS